MIGYIMYSTDGTQPAFKNVSQRNCFIASQMFINVLLKLTLNHAYNIASVWLLYINTNTKIQKLWR